MRAMALVLALALWPAAAGATALERCADPRLDTGATLDACRAALRDPDLRPGLRARVLVNLGVAQAALGRHGDAARSFDLARRTDPALVDAHANRARSLAELGRIEDALADFSAALDLAPRRSDLWVGRGALRLRSGDAAGAIDDLDRAIRLDRENTAAFFNRGLAYLEAGEAQEANADFSVVIRRAPEDAAAHLYRAEARAALGRGDAAPDYDRAVALAPDWGQALYLRGRYRDRRGERDAANDDFLRAYELGVEDRWLAERVQGIGG